MSRKIEVYYWTSKQSKYVCQKKKWKGKKNEKRKRPEMYGGVQGPVIGKNMAVTSALLTLDPYCVHLHCTCTFFGSVIMAVSRTGVSLD